MTTNHRRISDYDYTRTNQKSRDYEQSIPNNTGSITNRSKTGPYNVTEKDFGDHKVLYFIPSTYEDDYDLSQLDEKPFYQEQRTYSPRPVVRRRYYQSSDDEDEQYMEELPSISPRRYRYIPSDRPQVIKRIYYEPSPPATQITDYIFEEDYRPKNEEVIEYIVQSRAPKRVKFKKEATFYFKFFF